MQKEHEALRSHLAFAFVVVATVLSALVLATGTAEAKVINKTIWNPDVAYSGADGSFQPLEKTMGSYDITGDGTADALKLELTDTGKLVVRINGRKAASISAPGGGYDANIQVKYLSMENGTPFLYIRYTGVNADGAYAVYQGKSGNRLVKVAGNGDFPKKHATGHRYLGTVKASGNKLLVTYRPMTYAAGVVDLTYTFKASKKGATVKRTSSTTSKVGVPYGLGSSAKLHAVKRIKLYTTAKADKVAGYVAKGQKLAIKKVCLKGGSKGKTVMFKVKTASGLAGWLKAPTSSTGYWGSDGHVGTLFRETTLAG